MADVRYGIIGSGMMGIEHMLNIAALDGAVVTAVADPHPPSQVMAAEIAGPIALFDDHRQLLESGLVDAVVIAAPNHLHHQMILDTIATGMHMLTEKPMCTTVEQCLEVREAAAASTAVNWVGLEYRYMPAVEAMLETAASGVAGDTRMVTVREHRFPFLDKVGHWNRFRANTGGTLIEKCCHFFDLMTLIAGARPVRVMASGAQDVEYKDEKYGGERPDIMDNALVIVEYANGVRGMLDLCMFAEGTRYQQHITITGSDGKVESLVPPGHTAAASRLVVSTRAKGVVADGVVDESHVAHAGLHHGSSYLEHRDFLAAIRNGTPAKVTVEDGLWSVAVGAAAHLSIDERRSVDLAELIPGA